MGYKLEYNTLVVCIGYTSEQKKLSDIPTHKLKGAKWENGLDWYPVKSDNYVKVKTIKSKLVRVMYE